MNHFPIEQRMLTYLGQSIYNNFMYQFSQEISMDQKIRQRVGNLVSKFLDDSENAEFFDENRTNFSALELKIQTIAPDSSLNSTQQSKLIIIAKECFFDAIKKVVLELQDIDEFFVEIKNAKNSSQAFNKLTKLKLITIKTINSKECENIEYLIVYIFKHLNCLIPHFEKISNEIAHDFSNYIIEFLLQLMSKTDENKKLALIAVANMNFNDLHENIKLFNKLEVLFSVIKWRVLFVENGGLQKICSLIEIKQNDLLENDELKKNAAETTIISAIRILKKFCGGNAENQCLSVEEIFKTYNTQQIALYFIKYLKSNDANKISKAFSFLFMLPDPIIANLILEHHLLNWVPDLFNNQRMDVLRIARSCFLKFFENPETRLATLQYTKKRLEDFLWKRNSFISKQVENDELMDLWSKILTNDYDQCTYIANLFFILISQYSINNATKFGLHFIKNGNENQMIIEQVIKPRILEFLTSKNDKLINMSLLFLIYLSDSLIIDMISNHHLLNKLRCLLNFPNNIVAIKAEKCYENFLTKPATKPAALHYFEKHERKD